MCGNIKLNVKAEKHLSMWKSQEQAFQEVRSPPGGGSWCFWGRTRRSQCLGPSSRFANICYSHNSKSHLKDEEIEIKMW